MNLRRLKETPPWDWPSDAGQTLLDALRDRRTGEADLELAAELAGDLTVIDDEMVEALLAVLQGGDRSAAVRGRAAIALGPVLEELDMDPEAADAPITPATFDRIRESLRALYADAGVPTSVRRRAMEASVRAPEDWHADAVRAAYASDDEDWRLTGVVCMRFVQGFEPQILEALESARPDIRREALLAAGVWTLDAAWPHVAAVLTSPESDKALLLEAIDAAASIRPREALVLFDDLADHDDDEVADAIADALALVGIADELADFDDLDDDDEP